jgi:hypothetical protein
MSPRRLQAQRTDRTLGLFLSEARSGGWNAGTEERRYRPWPPNVGFSVTTDVSLGCDEFQVGAKSG